MMVIGNTRESLNLVLRKDERDLRNRDRSVMFVTFGIFLDQSRDLKMICNF